MKSSRSQANTAVLVALAVTAACSLWLSEIALFVAFLTLLAWLSLKPETKAQKRASYWVLGLVAVTSGIGLVRFVSQYALAGMLKAGKANLDKGNISRLREILFAEDQARERAIVDPDRDGIGSALFLESLAGVAPLRDAEDKRVRLLDRRFSQIVTTKIGPAASINGYLFSICLPTRAGLSAQPDVPVDEERAERRFIAYAWPLTKNVGNGKLFAIDQHERIMESENGGENGPLYFGTQEPPACDAWERSKLGLRSWQNKQPRSSLPGDRQARP